MEAMPQAIHLFDGYHPGRGLSGWYRDLTVAEAKKCSGTLYAIDRIGRVREVRLNGAPKTWKTFPGCELSLKYGLRECFRVGSRDYPENAAISHRAGTRIVVPVRENFSDDTPQQIVQDWIEEHELPS